MSKDERDPEVRLQIDEVGRRVPGFEDRGIQKVPAPPDERREPSSPVEPREIH